MDVLEQLPEAGTLHLRDRPLVVLHRPFPEVVVERTDGVLDEAPQRPAVLRHDRLEPGAGHLLGPGAAVVRGHQLLEVLVVEPALCPGVAELEAGVVVAGVVVVDQPDLLAVVDEVLGEQVVVARDGALVVHGQGSLDLGEGVGVVVVPVGDAEALALAALAVARLPREHVEVVDETRSLVELADRRRRARREAVGPEGLVAQGDALDEADHQQAEVGTAREDRCPHAGLGRRARVRSLGLAVDVEVLGVVLAHPYDEDTVGGGHLDVAVGQSSGEVLDLERLARQDGDLREALVQLALGQGEDRHSSTLGRQRTGTTASAKRGDRA